MVRLCLDTSSDYLLMIIAENNEVLCSVKVKAGRKMSELLLEQIDNALDSLSMSISDIDEFYACTGPGSFTGVRIGVSMVLGLSEGLGRQAYGLSSLDIQASACKEDTCRIVSQLKGDNCAVKEYNFITDEFSDYKVLDINKEQLSGYVKVNIDGCCIPDLEGAVKSGRLWQFGSDCVPLYLRKAEAELSFDKKGCS